MKIIICYITKYIRNLNEEIFFHLYSGECNSFHLMIFIALKFRRRKKIAYVQSMNSDNDFLQFYDIWLFSKKFHFLTLIAYFYFQSDENMIKYYNKI